MARLRDQSRQDPSDAMSPNAKAVRYQNGCITREPIRGREEHNGTQKCCMQRGRSTATGNLRCTAGWGLDEHEGRPFRRRVQS